MLIHGTFNPFQFEIEINLENTNTREFTFEFTFKTTFNVIYNNGQSFVYKQKHNLIQFLATQ